MGSKIGEGAAARDGWSLEGFEMETTRGLV